ncbi:MAG: DUF5694 domain-containing protein [Amphiplicatus sp.]
MNAMKKMLGGLVVAAALISFAGAQGLPERPKPVAKVMIVGVYHFANPGRDQFNAQADNVLSDKRQEEIKAIINGLSKFEPTVVAVEADAGDGVEDKFRAWRAGESALTENETQQLGFRLAAAAGLENVSPFDAEYRFVSDQEMALDETDERLKEIEAATQNLGKNFIAELERRQKASSIGDVLAWMNSEEALDANSDFYLGYKIKRWSGDNAGGAYTVANWYTRNLLMFQNLLKLVENGKDERVIVIVGQGHASILRYLVEESPWLTLEDPLDYLPRE